MKKIFYLRTYYQVIFALQMVDTIYKNDEVYFLISDDSKGAERVAEVLAMLINQNRPLQYFGQISLMVLCIHGPVYRIVVKIVSIPLHMGPDAVRENILLAMIVVVATMLICSMAYEVVVQIAPWMVGNKKQKVL